MKKLKILLLPALVSLMTSISGTAEAAYDFSDNVAPSSNPPGGLSPDQVPQFVVIGFDDNSRSGDSLMLDSRTLIPGNTGMRWAINFFHDLKNPAGSGNPATYDGTPARVSFYHTSYYVSGYNGDNPAVLRLAWHQAWKDGHETGNHTQSHSEALVSGDAAKWDFEVKTCNSWLTKPLAPDTLAFWQQAEKTDYGSAIPAEEIVGFRTPFLAYGGSVFPTLKANNIMYDCTIEEGYQEDQDGTDFLWPYTLDNGSPGHEVLKDMGLKKFDITPTSGLWEVPNHVVIVPPDELCSKYGVDHSIRAKMKTAMSWFDTENGKFTGFDWNFWKQAGLNKQETVAILKYTLDLRYHGNRCPFMWGAHSDNFIAEKNSIYTGISNEERKAAIEEFIQYALSLPDVRVVAAKDIINWCRNPVALGKTTAITDRTGVQRKANLTIRGAARSVSFTVPNAGSYAVSLYSLDGRSVLHSENRYYAAGTHLITPTSVSSGMYLVRIAGTAGAASARLYLRSRN